MVLRDILLAWDGKKTEPLQAAFEAGQADPEFMPSLVFFLGEETLQPAASWLLKRGVEQGELPDPALTELLLGFLPICRHWATRLHLLQILPYLTLPQSRKVEVETFVRDAMADKNKFVRAWSYSGFYHLAVCFPEYREALPSLLERGLAEEAASVKARIRRLLKQGLP